MDLVFDWCRYPSIIIKRNQLRWLLLLVHLFPSILKYFFSHFLIPRCYCSQISHQTQEILWLIPAPVSSLPYKSHVIPKSPNTHSIQLLAHPKYPSPQQTPSKHTYISYNTYKKHSASWSCPLFWTFYCCGLPQAGFWSWLWKIIRRTGGFAKTAFP